MVYTTVARDLCEHAHMHLISVRNVAMQNQKLKVIFTGHSILHVYARAISHTLQVGRLAQSDESE